MRPELLACHQICETRRRPVYEYVVFWPAII